ncbi:tetratricopeptide repeat-containing sensor histidine kinase [Hymenobacter wooponensis]|uniref:Tetratricopeptide repeat protein n=1 Tax=Hymenobacter wooponensis TaxID=1525360 RepID=A0A4Z0MCD4_9BACT|nr:ATP-binding protein [Hymenobacter wooponensis]TGD77154.1 tetratricopeptide repeat protein [Hymenobacter wooponensis]
MWLLTSTATAQLVPDSLLHQLQTATSDTQRAKVAVRLSIASTASDTAQAGQYARQGLQVSTAAHFLYGQAHAYMQLGTLANIRNDNALAARYYGRALVLAENLYQRQPSTRHLKLLAALANNQGNVYDRLGQYQQAVQQYLRASTYLLRLRDDVTLQTVYGNLGNSFLVLNQPKEAARYWRRAVAVRLPARPQPSLVPVYLQLAGLHLQNRQLDSAWVQLSQARRLMPQAELYTGEYYGTLGQYYLQQGELQAARQAFKQALEFASRKGAVGYQAKLLFGLGQVDEQAGNLAEARARMQRSMALAEELGDPQQQLSNLEALAALEERATDWLQALRYQKRIQALHDTLTNAAVRARVNTLETKYRTQQQAQELISLRREQAVQQHELAQQRQLNALYLGLVAALTVVGGLGLVLVRHRQRLIRQRQELQRQQIQQLEQEKVLLKTEAMLQGQEEERSRLARDLHDGLGGMLSTVRLYLGALGGRVVLPDESARFFTQSVEHLDSSISELRRVARNMMPETLLRFGLVQALRDVCDATQQTGALQVQFQVHGLDERLDQRTEVVVFRIAQELLTNVIRHAQARSVIVQLMRHDTQLQLVVEDDGRGFQPAAARAGVGLRSIQSRASYLNAHLDIQSGPGQGTSVTLEFSLAPTTTIPAQNQDHSL